MPTQPPVPTSVPDQSAIDAQVAAIVAKLGNNPIVDQMVFIDGTTKTVRFSEILAAELVAAETRGIAAGFAEGQS